MLNSMSRGAELTGVAQGYGSRTEASAAHRTECLRLFLGSTVPIGDIEELGAHSWVLSQG